ncbi:MAG TPA: hypothetical protein VF756_10020 [Thermoanaerobaculia bacterium]
MPDDALQRGEHQAPHLVGRQLQGVHGGKGYTPAVPSVIRSPRRLAPDLGIAALLAVAVWVLYGPALRLWWMYDDLYHLHYQLTHAPVWYLFDVRAWQEFSAKVLTPLLFFSLDADRVLFGLSPRAFYLHQITALSLCPAALYGVLRLWLPRAWAAAGAFLFLIGPTVSSLSTLLMVRHYIEAVLLALLSVALYILALRRGSWALAAASGVLYLLAVLTKEIAVPLALFLLLIPERDLRERFRFALPCLAALIFYLGLRLYFLGTLGGGYGFAVEPGGWARLVLELPGKVAAEILGDSSSAGWRMLGAILAGLVAAAVFVRGAALRIAVAAVLVLAPVLPVSTKFEPRYAVPAWLLAVVAFAFGARALAERGRPFRLLAAGLAVVACAGGLVANRRDWEGRFARAERMSIENRSFLSLGEGDFLRRPLSPSASLGELRWWKEEMWGLPRGAGWFLDDLYLCLRGEEIRRLWAYDPVEREVKDVTRDLPAIRRRYCSSIRREVPLSAEVRAQGPVLFWELGPYPEGSYWLVMADGAQAIEVPRIGGFQTRGMEKLALRVKYRSPEGWVTYSPELVVDLTRGPFRWESLGLKPQAGKFRPYGATPPPEARP